MNIHHFEFVWWVVYSRWSGAIAWRQDRLSARDLAVGQYEQGAQERGGVTDVQAELGEDAPDTSPCQRVKSRWRVR
uniref:Uncharacterized protein n=1 Tax=Streptomyces sp. NBC_00119 TaxID=2975659 RepID=A0AAU1ULA1_9ACTN